MHYSPRRFLVPLGINYLLRRPAPAKQGNPPVACPIASSDLCLSNAVEQQERQHLPTTTTTTTTTTTNTNQPTNQGAQGMCLCCNFAMCTDGSTS